MSKNKWLIEYYKNMNLNFGTMTPQTLIKMSICPVCKKSLKYDLSYLCDHLCTCNLKCQPMSISNNKITYSNIPSVVKDVSYLTVIFTNEQDKTVDVVAFSNQENMKEHFLEVHFINPTTNCTQTVKVPIILEWDKLTQAHIGRFPKCIFDKYPVEFTFVCTQKLPNLLNNWITYNKIIDAGISASFNDSEVIIKNQTLNKNKSKKDNEMFMSKDTFQFTI